MMEKLSQAGQGGGSTPTHFYYIYHHIQSCGVRSNWEGRYILPISLQYSTPPLYALRGFFFQCQMELGTKAEAVFWKKVWTLKRYIFSWKLGFLGRKVGFSGRKADFFAEKIPCQRPYSLLEIGPGKEKLETVALQQEIES